MTDKNSKMSNRLLLFLGFFIIALGFCHFGYGRLVGCVDSDSVFCVLARNDGSLKNIINDFYFTDWKKPNSCILPFESRRGLNLKDSKILRYRVGYRPDLLVWRTYYEAEYLSPDGHKFTGPALGPLPFTAPNVIVSALFIATGAILVLWRVGKTRKMIKEKYDVQKLKTSKLAIASLLIPCISLVSSLCFICVLQHHHYIHLSNWLFPAPFAGLYLSAISLFFGIVALIKIIWNQGLLKGYIFAILGVLMSLFAINYGRQAVDIIKPESRIMHCQVNMRLLQNAIRDYSDKHDNQYPAITEWCDLLANLPDIYKSMFLCPDSPDWYRGNREQLNKCSYAINPNAEPNSAGDVVLLFETKDGWNQFGGPELMSFENHYRKGCNILFNDGHVEFIAPKQKDKLKWGG